MPVYPPPKSLQCWAVDNVVNLIMDFKFKVKTEDNGLFNILTTEMCHDLFRELIRRKKLKKDHIYLLINPVSIKIQLNST